MRASGRLLNAKIDARKLAFISASGSHGVQQAKESHMSGCLQHCDIRELLESQLQSQEVNLAEIAGKVTEVLADLILTAPPDEHPC